MATHSGTFHADDVFAYAILKMATAGQLELIRTRDGGRLAEADVVFDVGGVFDPAARRYDHHMRDKPLRADGAPYSSAGLVWRDFGLDALRAYLPEASSETLDKIWRSLDGGLIRDVDLMDNGATTPMAGHFSTLVEAWNPTFAEETRDENDAFRDASIVVLAVFARVIARAQAAVLAVDAVALAARTAVYPGILVLEQRLPWEDAVFDLNLTEIFYVVRPAGTDWTCSAVPPEKGSFAQRRPLPDAWAGLRDEALAKVSSVPDATFCHPARFVCGARSRDGAVALARLAVASGEENSFLLIH
ncbi:MYG1 family protein [Telmatospirillum sp.]|uniref:MYG1 family protein n=1 Tax=Telmatospirillum sp. TaxID=2079197 RepID=UPI00284E9934|nr:MYG1 family protein [Telmatospirillum sp.]MDR3436379.1 MYG1 family protein [Telmatospirillum sp.]